MSCAPPQGGKPPHLPLSLRSFCLAAVGRGEGWRWGTLHRPRQGCTGPFRYQLLPEAWLGALRAKQFMGTEDRAAGGSMTSGWADPRCFFSGDYLYLGRMGWEQASYLSPHTPAL